MPDIFIFRVKWFVRDSDGLWSSLICQNPLLASKVESTEPCEMRHLTLLLSGGVVLGELCLGLLDLCKIVYLGYLFSGLRCRCVIVSSSFLIASSITSGTLWDGLMTKVTLSSSVILYTNEVYELKTTESFQVEIFNEYNNLFNGALGEVPVNVSPP